MLVLALVVVVVLTPTVADVLVSYEKVSSRAHHPPCRMDGRQRCQS